MFTPHKKALFCLLRFAIYTDIHVPQESVEFILWYKMETAGLWKASVSVYMTTGCCNSLDRNRSTETLQSLEQRDLLKISDT